MNNNKFIRDMPFEKRCMLIKELREKYPDRLPVLIYDDKKVNKAIKLLIPPNMTISNILCIIRKKMELKSDESIYLFINVYSDNKNNNLKIKENILCNTSDLLSTLYNKYKDNDNMLYIMYCKENTFG